MARKIEGSSTRNGKRVRRTSMLDPNDAFDDCASITVALAMSFHKTTGIDMELLLSRAHEAFMDALNSYNPKHKASLKTWVRTITVQRLIDFTRWWFHMEHPGQEDINFDTFTGSDMHPAASYVFIETLVDRLSIPAQEACWIVLTAPCDLLNVPAHLATPRILRGALYRHMLKEWNMTWRSVWAVFAEIKGVLRNGTRA